MGVPAVALGSSVVGFRNQDAVAGGDATITQLSIANAAGTTLGSIIVAGPHVSGTNVTQDAGMVYDPYFAVLVPINPLPAGTYTVTLHAAIGGGMALGQTRWSFTVAAP